LNFKPLQSEDSDKCSTRIKVGKRLTFFNKTEVKENIDDFTA